MGILVAFFRIISLILIASALMALGYDAFTYFQDKTHQISSLVDIAGLLQHPDVFKSWPSFLQPIIGLPAFLVLGVLGIVLAIICKIAHRS